MNNNQTLSKKWERYINNQYKTIEIINGDMCELQKECDVAVCSAFRGDYVPYYGTLLHSLYQKNIDVEKLSVAPELDFRNAGCWLSADTGTSFRRIACVELLSGYTYASERSHSDIVLRKSLSTLCYLIEQAHLNDIPVETITMPLLGGGQQGIEIEYILAPLISNCKRMLESDYGVNHIIIYEKNLEKTKKMIAAFQAALQTKSDIPEVFLSYSSKQINEVQQLCEFLEKNNVSCWMAPLSIPAGSSYLDEIPAAISNVKTMIIFLTKDAESSPWVRKEVSSALAAHKHILPYMPYQFALGEAFTFLLDGEQIFPGYLSNDDGYSKLYKRLIDLIL